MIEIDVDHQVKAVQRDVGTRTIDTGEAHVITVSQSYGTDPADLWDAVTNIDRIPRWFLPISGDLKVGGSYQLEGHASGTILSCDPPENFAATWEYGGNVSWIDVSIKGEGPDRARLVIEHIVKADDEIWCEFGPGAMGIGWDSMVLGLAIHLSTGESIDPSFGQQWTGTEDGRHFLTMSGEEWYAANVAAGEDPAGARALADRCLKAYLGEELN
ncbi:SRPBCC domain-containing protein [Mycobacterium sp.]|uniref:SRPBCC domain-containing protein n=1 Tax=Mycobacterium sp. TaxID=1785 RepID=UPI002CC0DC70|nr:SRPBCC domain-containing protein [Mycobacterium sp.]HKP40848.1 SRPBCC domain-containing protein [Mycobacterium sp.]